MQENENLGAPSNNGEALNVLLFCIADKIPQMHLEKH